MSLFALGPRAGHVACTWYDDVNPVVLVYFALRYCCTIHHRILPKLYDRRELSIPHIQGENTLA